MSKYEKTSKTNIYTKETKNGDIHYFMRLKVQNRLLPFKNLTLAFNINSLNKAYEKMKELRTQYRNGIDPFKKIFTYKELILNNIWDKKIEEVKKNNVWRATTLNGYVRFYERFLRDTLGKKSILDITKKDVEDFRDLTLMNYGSTYKKRLLLILNSIIEDYVDKKVIEKNFIQEIKVEKVVKKKPISQRAQDTSKKFSHIEIAQTLYHAIDNYEAQWEHQREEIKIFLYFLLMTSHRYGEIMQLKYKDINLELNLVKANEKITKSKREYVYPYPQECHDFFVKNYKKDELIFTSFSYKSIDQIFKRLVRISNVSVKLSAHDTRSLLLNSLGELGIDILKASNCLEHSITGVLKHYADITFYDKVQFFYKYWETIREPMSK